MAFAAIGSADGMSGVADDIGCSAQWREYSSFGSDIDLASSVTGGPARAIMVTDVGSGSKLLAVTAADGNAQTITVTNLQGVLIPGGVRKITGTTTTVARVLVFW